MSVMGYSIRDPRWRLTVWRDRNGSNVAATELYDEQNDQNETVNVADKPENKSVIDALSKYLPPVGSSAEPVVAKFAQSSKAKKESDSSKEAKERGATFDRIDKSKVGKVTLEEYQARQSDKKEAAKRFKKWDLNKDHFLSRDEYIKQGSKK